MLLRIINFDIFYPVHVLVISFGLVRNLIMYKTCFQCFIFENWWSNIDYARFVVEMLLSCRYFPLRIIRQVHEVGSINNLSFKEFLALIGMFRLVIHLFENIGLGVSFCVEELVQTSITLQRHLLFRSKWIMFLSTLESNGLLWRKLECSSGCLGSHIVDSFAHDTHLILMVIH